MNPKRYILFAALQVISIFAFCQNRNIRFDRIGTDQGLSQSNVICILQDRQGFMWFGTRDGLNKYDGYNFTIYKNDANNKASISANFVPSIFEGRDGNLWIATWGGGLNIYNPGKDQFTSYKHDPQNSNSIASDFVNAVMEDSQGMVWIGTEDGGLDMFDKKTNKFRHFIYDRNNPKSLGDIFVRHIFEDSQHNIWVGTAHGGLNLYNRTTQTFSRFQFSEKDSQSISSNNVYRIFEDSKHRLWIGTEGGGLNLFNQETGQFRHFRHDLLNKNSLASDAVYSINEDVKGNIWVGTENGGLSIYNPSSGIFETYNNDEFDNTSLSNNSVWSICRDNRGNTWLGTFNGGINIINQDAGKFIHYKHNPSKNSLSYNKVLCIYEDHRSNVWIGTDGGGLNLFDPKNSSFTYFRHQPGNLNSIAGDYVLSVCEDSKENLWIGTWGDGITVFNRETNTYQHYRNNPDDSGSLSSNNAWTIFEDRDRNIWVGTYGGGLNRFNPETNSFIHYQFDENNHSGINNNKIHSIFEDTKGNMWVGTDGGGLNLFNKENNTFTHFIHDDKKNSISNNSVGAIYEDWNGILWISTMVGLNGFDPKTNTFTAYTTKDGLPNNSIFGILGDGRNNLWISTNKGLSRFSPVTRIFKNFGIDDGLQSNEFKEMAYCKTRSGTMYFGGNNGFNEFYPDSIKYNSFDPPLLITGFQIFNKEIPIADKNIDSPLKENITQTKEITISYKSSVISFEFASLNYTTPDKKQYEYMLEPFDNKWNDIGMRHTATYTNLNPGTYIFKVRGLNNDGSWATTFTSIQLTITPPFWKTWWFRILVVLAAVGIVVALHRFRMRAVNAQKKRLERQLEVLDKAVAQGKFEVASNVMHDIGNAVVGFGSYLTRVRRIQETDNPENIENLAGFFDEQKSQISTVIGPDKAGAVVSILNGIAQTQRRNKEEISNAVTQQLNIIANIEEILHIQRQYINGHEKQERKAVNLKNTINDCISMLFGSIDKMAIDVSLNIAAEQPIVKGDQTKLMQLILNILKNSVEAIDTHSPRKTIDLSVYSQTDQLILQVQDSGNGFDKQVADQLFLKGFTTKPSNLGLGLYNSRAILESHEGTIKVTSAGIGKGALTTIGFKIA